MLLTPGRSLAGLVIVLVCSMACSVLTVAAYHVLFSQKTVVIDIAGFITAQKEGYMTGKISARELVDNIDSLMSRIKTVKMDDVLVVDREAARLPGEGATIGVPDLEPDDDGQ